MDQSNKSLKTGSYNCTGLFGDNKIGYVKDLIVMNKLDLLLLQETWLVSNGMHTLNSVHDDYSAHGVSGVPSDQLIAGRPYGGVAILWNAVLDKDVKIIEVKCNMLCGIELSLSNVKCLVTCCYMPCDNYSGSHVNDEFLQVCDALECLLIKYPNHKVILGGDMNVDLCRGNAHAQYYEMLLQRNNLVDLWTHFI